MEDVKDVLHDIEKWAAAYKILQDWYENSCSESELECGCDECGFAEYCNKASNLVNK